MARGPRPIEAWGGQRSWAERGSILRERGARPAAAPLSTTCILSRASLRGDAGGERIT